MSRVLGLVALLTVVALPAPAVTELELDATIRGLQSAQSPLVMDDWVLFSYTADPAPRYVGARFEHEQFQQLHLYRRNESGVFVLLLHVPDGQDVVRYRVVVDGQWSADPFNPRISLGNLGFDFSVLELPPVERPLALGPSGRPGEVTFRFRGDPRQRVSVSGDFSSWDPVIYPMRETRPGLYEVTIPLPAGTYGYTFVLNGRRVLDPANPVLNNTSDGRSISWLTIR